MQLPASIRAVIDARLEGHSRQPLAASAAAISNGYRAGQNSSSVIRSDLAATAYAVARMPATYAAISRALGELRRALPAFAPRSLLDAGAGPGTASIAAVEVFASIRAMTMIDANPYLLKAAREFAAAYPRLAEAAIFERDLASNPSPLPSADLVIAGYALTEIAPIPRARLLERLWQATPQENQSVLLIVEPGTPSGFETLRADRATLIRLGAAIAAPCPHDAACPIEAPDWCHFAARAARSREHRLLKGGDAPFEDEKFAYLAASRMPVAGRVQRVLAPPQNSKAGIKLKLCAERGIEQRLISARLKPAYRAAKRLAWGSALDQVSD